MATNDRLTELAQTLGLTRGIKLWLRGAPPELRDAIGCDSLEIELLASPSAGMDVAVIVLDGDTKVERELQALSGMIQPAGHVWLLWKDGSIDADAARQAGTADGFVAGETHPLGDGWSGLRLDPEPTR